MRHSRANLSGFLVFFVFLYSSAAAAQEPQSRVPESPENYPEHWWKAVLDGQWWEILPQDAKPGEVVLSKRNELGLFSNFAHTPFYFHGRYYASVEGFWYMLAYPEGPEDLRAQATNVDWPYTRAQVSQMVGFEAKEAGARAEANMAALGINWITFEGQRMPYWSRERDEHYQLIHRVLWEKIRQNSELRDLLLRTGDLVLVPDNYDSLRNLPAWRYFDIYMEIRQSLKEGSAGPPSARYPPHWWKPVAERERASWEILPQAAAPGEVILSKRNELGLLSNFAATPFTYRVNTTPASKVFGK